MHKLNSKLWKYISIALGSIFLLALAIESASLNQNKFFLNIGKASISAFNTVFGNGGSGETLVELIDLKTEPQPTPLMKAPIEPIIILISEIMAGDEESGNHEFIELYNPNSKSVDLTGWSLKKISSRGKETSLVAYSRLKNKAIPPNGYFLIANNSFQGLNPDATWPTSNTLAYSQNSIKLYDGEGRIVDSVSWTKIPKGQSLIRESWNNRVLKVEPNPTPQNSK